ncbi:hypothetical protein L7F22_024133 [Adiantum nelumboides]|nr:hypothetical protein [Adiantum nelumboides]
MIGSFITRAIIMLSGYAYPAYECFKTVDKKRPDAERLQFWCQYWMIIAVLTMLERLGDTFISWLPMYSEAKLAFIIYLWYPKTKGTTYVYSTFLRPFVANHERGIDRHLNELRTRAGDMAFEYWQKGSVYAQSRLMEVLQYVASQSPSSTPQQGSAISQKSQSSSFGNQQPLVVNQEVRTGFKGEGTSQADYQQQPIPQVPPAHYQSQPPARQQSNEEDFEIMDTDELASVAEPVMSASVPRTRSRQRLRKQQ